MSALAPALVAFCRPRFQAWRLKKMQGDPCAACPMLAACTAPLVGALTVESLAQHVEAVNAAWLASGAAARPAV